MSKDLRGVSIITCTNRPQYFKDIIANFKTQRYQMKELIIVLNKDSMVLDKYRKQTQAYKNISIYKVSEKVSLGKCLNYGINKSKYPYIAKFDDDDYYSPYYLLEQIKYIKQTGADVIGKKAYLTYLEGRKLLLMRFPRQQHRFLGSVSGGTLLFKRKVFERVRFANVSLGEDVNFLSKCRAEGFRIYASSPHNYVAIRRKNKLSHTWTVGDSYLIAGSRVVARNNNFRQYAVKLVSENTI